MACRIGYQYLYISMAYLYTGGRGEGGGVFETVKLHALVFHTKKVITRAVEPMRLLTVGPIHVCGSNFMSGNWANILFYMYDLICG